MTPKITAEAESSIMHHYPLDQPWYDEVYRQEGKFRKHYHRILNHLGKISRADFIKLNELARLSFLNQGITFNVYTENPQGVERIFPFDMMPRLIQEAEWEHIQSGLIQRTKAINAFLRDIYHEKSIIREGIIPAKLVFSSTFFSKEMIGLMPPAEVYTHISGTDIIRHSDGHYYVLEDNVRCPSGVSYVLANREVMKRLYAQVFMNYNVKLIHDYPERLLAMMKSVSPQGIDDPTCVVLSPGMYNSAYFEHSYLAQRMGVQLVEGRDLYVDKNFVYMKTIRGPQKVDIIYRRIDDEYLDPLAFRSNSLLGVPGLMGAYRAGHVSLVNAPGTGVADDKAVYIYMPEIIRYYLQEEPILRNVPTYHASKAEDLAYILEHLQALVVKPVDESGGYGILFGNKLDSKELEDCRAMIQENPRKYIAQPIMNLSVHPTYVEETGAFEQRHIDLRTFTLMGGDGIHVLKGGLTRVALQKGNLVVNSSQGGGSKETWVLEEKGGAE